MSTRVHELAKELGLKTAELLDRIKKWNLDIKHNPSAGVEPSAADEVRALYAKETSGGTGAAVAEKSPSRSETQIIAPAPSAPATRPQGLTATPSPLSTPPAAPPVSSTPAGAPARSATPTGPQVAAPPTPSAGAQSGAARISAAPARTGLQDRPGGGAPPPQRPQASAPLAPRPGSAPLRAAGGGPLSGHTTAHRTGGGLSSRIGGGASGGGGGHDLRPHPVSPAPLKRTDYISPSGTRGSSPPSGGLVPGSRKVGDSAQQGQGPAEAGRRESGPSTGGRRPLPPVASAAAPIAPERKPGPRFGGPEVKTQRPDKKYTPEQLREMMQAGKIAGGPPPAAGARPARPGALGRGDAPAPLARRGPAVEAAPPVMVDEEDDRRKAGRLGSPVERAGRRAKRNERALVRRVTSPLPASALLNEDEEGRRVRGRRGGHSKKHKGAALAPLKKDHVVVEPPINVRSLSMALGISGSQILSKLMAMGRLATINSEVEEESAQMIAFDFGIELVVEYPTTAEDEMLQSIQARGESSQGSAPRPPIVTILGHVDHGKTSLLDRIRKADVAKHESGGITQHIGAYQIEHEGRKITFVDTPGHEAFTAMRARGANVTDIVILVVAADDGVMPQTVEAISHAKAAGVPIIVALNKIDLPNVNINKIYGELSQQDLVPQEYGGDTEVVKTSAVTGLGISDLLETIGILADLRELKADPTLPATGTCLEAALSEGRGVIASVLVQDGTLRVGDVIVCGDGFGRVRSIYSDRGVLLQEAGPSTPVEVSGLDAVPTAGERFAVVDDIPRAREVAETRRERARGVNLGERQAITLENLFTRMTEQKVKSLNLILKADVQGSLEALSKELEKLINPEVPIRVLHKGVGGITESDVLLAHASDAIVVGFRVAPEDKAISLADDQSVEIRRYDIIYQVTDEIKKAVEGLLVPEIKETHLGRANVRQVFKISRVGSVAGCIVASGNIERGAGARIIREGREIYKGTIEALKRFKDDVREVREGFECGIKISNFDDIKAGDTIEAYKVEKVRRTL